ncbi:protein clec16a homolog [Phtheirospermum japonicum]|uniref:Protein clec16a homolog n=1 Tax=Phtheirospermum japonicum TaxID=374723 RepID=A0A830BI18_9LAMI|nr:protein clec16a homolog [Phtheirospermum japonicum]
MWFSFWKSRDRYSLDELRFLIDQLMKVQIVNEVNKDFVIEALRSVSELITYGDQHDAAYFECDINASLFFMEKQVMGEFVRILRISRTLIVSLQLLQTMSIMIQNLKSDHSIYYMFSNEHVNYLITYQFDFRNEELLSYYISFLRFALEFCCFMLSLIVLSILSYTSLHHFLEFCLPDTGFSTACGLGKGNKWEVEQGYNFSPS